MATETLSRFGKSSIELRLEHPLDEYSKMLTELVRDIA